MLTVPLGKFQILSPNLTQVSTIIFLQQIASRKISDPRLLFLVTKRIVLFNAGLSLCRIHFHNVVRHYKPQLDSNQALSVDTTLTMCENMGEHSTVLDT